MSHHRLSHHSKVGPDRCLLDLRPYGPKGIEHDVAAGRAQRLDAQVPAAAAGDELLAQLGQFRDVLEAGEPEEQKAVVRGLPSGNQGRKDNAAGGPSLVPPTAPFIS
jgi:hypothetical protein